MTRLIAPLPLVVLLACGCASSPGEPRRPPPASAANPASVACVQGGGISEIRRHRDGEAYGVCRLPDGKVCEEWTLYQDKLCVMPREGGC